MTGFLAAMGLERLVEFAPDMGPTTGDIKIAQGRGARIGLIAIADDNALLAIESFQGDSMAPGWQMMVQHDRPVGWPGVLDRDARWIHRVPARLFQDLDCGFIHAQHALFRQMVRFAGRVEADHGRKGFS